MTRVTPRQVYLPVTQSFVEVGAVVARGERIGVNRALVHASICGRVTSIAPRDRFLDEPLPGLHIAIESDGVEASDHHLNPLSEPDANAIIQRCSDAGVVGLGGGGFPTADKLLAAKGQIHTLVLNLMESDAGIGADAHLAKTNMTALLRGAELALQATDAERIIIAAPATLATELAGQTKHSVSTPVIGEPIGEERRLLEGLFGISVARTSTPIDAGYLVLNGATCAAIADAVDDGKAVTDRVVRVDSSVFRVPIGTPIATLVNIEGGQWRAGSSVSGERLHVDACVGKTTYAISQESRRGSAPCIRCGLCRNACPEPLLPDELIWWQQDSERIEALSVDRCLECGLCDAVCPSDIRLTDLIRAGKRQLNRAREQKREAELSLARVNARNVRLGERALVDENRREARLARLAKKRSARTQP